APVEPEQAERRWNYVLDRMVADGYLEQAEREDMEFPKVRKHRQSDTYAGPQGYLLDMVRRELVERSPLTEDDVDTAGLRIVTTIDPAMQEAAVAAIDELPEDTPERLRTAIVTLDATDGAILALRRPGLPRAAAERGDPGHRPGRVDVQALHARGRPRGGHRPAHDVQREQPRLRRGLPRGPRRAQLRQHVLRHGRPRARDR